MSLWLVLSVLNDVLYDALPYGLVCLGMLWTAKYIRFPDLTASGTFVLGGAAAALTIVRFDCSPSVAVSVAVAAGAVGGLLTGTLYLGLQMDRLLAGIVSSFVLYNVNLLFLASTLPYGDRSTLLTAAWKIDRTLVVPGLSVGWHPVAITVLVAFVVSVKLLMDVYFRSASGLALRALEDDGAGEEALLRQGLSPRRYRLAALVIGNATIGLAGALVSFQEGAANANRGFDVLVTGLIALLVGLQFCKSTDQLRRWFARMTESRWLELLKVKATTGAVVGAIIYFSAVTASQRVGIDPSYAKILLAVLIAVSVADVQALKHIRWYRKPREGNPARTPASLLEVNGLDFSYPSADVATLKGVTLSVTHGEAVWLRGGNGSGKTTTLRVLAGFLMPGDGSKLVLNGDDVTAAPHQRLKQIAYVDQDPHRGVVGLLTPLENLALASAGSRPSPWRRAVGSAEKKRLTRLAVASGLPPSVISIPAASLSGGQRQVLNLLGLQVRAEKPKLVLLDEPMNNLDAVNLERCRRIIDSIHKDGIALVIVSHGEPDDFVALRQIDMGHANRAATQLHEPRALSLA